MENINKKSNHFIKQRKILSIFLTLITMFSVFTCAVPTWATYYDSVTETETEEKPKNPLDISGPNGWKVTLSDTTIMQNSERRKDKDDNSYIPEITVKTADGKKIYKYDYIADFYYNGGDGYEKIRDSESIADIGDYEIRISPRNTTFYTNYIVANYAVKPNKITNVTCENVTSNSATLTWTPIDSKSNNAIYYIYSYDNKTKKYECIAKTFSNSKLITNLSPNKNYSFKVQAKASSNKSIVGNYSSTCDVTTKINFFDLALGVEGIGIISCIIVIISAKKKKTIK